MTRRPPEHLVAARRRDVNAKRDRVRAATHRIHSAGHRVTIARVAREAQVSTWFVYNTPELLSTVREAMRDQLDNGPESHPTPATSHSLTTDLTLAREEIRDLRTERDRLRTRVQLNLGAELDTTTRQEFVDRISSLETETAALRAQLTAAITTKSALEQQITTITEDLDGARLSLRRMMRQATPASITAGQGLA
jgi:chromosome segregation ATPase